MIPSPQGKLFSFRGSYYPIDVIRTTACKALGIKEDCSLNNEQLQELIDAIVKGPPTPCALFIVTLNRWTPSKARDE